VQVQDAAITGLAASNMSPKTAGSPVSLTASITGGTNVAYAWNFGDGTTGTGASPTHTYSAPGSYTATVTATNSLGSSTASTTVIVRGAVFLPIIVR
jgi:PKD repeat protein